MSWKESPKDLEGGRWVRTPWGGGLWGKTRPYQIPKRDMLTQLPPFPYGKPCAASYLLSSIFKYDLRGWDKDSLLFMSRMQVIARGFR
jgi:hypothetical protein